MRSLLLLCLALPAQADVIYTDDSAAQPFSHIYGGGWEHFVGGGVAAFDCNADTLPDLFMAGGENTATLAINASTPGGTLQFTATDTGITGVTGAYPLDIDNDTFTDLIVLRAGANLILRGTGACGFHDVTADWAFDAGERWSTAFSAVWEGDAAWPTLAIGNYVDRTDSNGPFEACDVNELHRPDGATYAAPYILAPGFCPLSMLISDPMGQGNPMLRVSNDRHYYVRGGAEQMWTLDTQPRLLTEADGWVTHNLWGMGIASRDISGDGVAEVMLTSMGDQRLQLLTDTGWRDAPFSTGTASQRPYTGDDGRPSTGWHAAFGDVNNDGFDDLFIAKGNVDQMPVAAMADPNNLLINDGTGTFSEAGETAGLATLARSRGAALADFNADGLLDVVVINRRAPAEFHRNVTPDAGNWLGIDLRQAHVNINAVGAMIELRVAQRSYWREVTVGGGHAGGQMLPQHFGLGAANTADARIHWPNGTLSDWASYSAGQVHIVTP